MIRNCALSVSHASKDAGLEFKHVAHGTTEAGQRLAAVERVIFGQMQHRLIGTVDFDGTVLRVDNPYERRAEADPHAGFVIELPGPVIRRDNLDCQVRGALEISRDISIQREPTGGDIGDIRRPYCIGVAFEQETHFGSQDLPEAPGLDEATQQNCQIHHNVVVSYCCWHRLAKRPLYQFATNLFAIKAEKVVGRQQFLFWACHCSSPIGDEVRALYYSSGGPRGRPYRLSAEGRGEHLGRIASLCAAAQQFAGQRHFTSINHCSGEDQRALVGRRGETGGRSPRCKVRSYP